HRHQALHGRRLRRARQRALLHGQDHDDLRRRQEGARGHGQGARVALRRADRAPRGGARPASPASARRPRSALPEGENAHARPAAARRACCYAWLPSASAEPMNGTPDITAIKVIAFDVFGTVVDWHGTIAREVDAMRLGVDGSEFALAWRAGY